MACRITFWQILGPAFKHRAITVAPRWKGRAAVNKRTIALLSLAAIVLLLTAFVGFGPAFATQLRTCQSATNNPYATNCLSSASGAVVIGFVLYLAGALAALVAWIMGLITTVHLRRWGWFVAVLLISPLGSLLYGLAGPTQRKA
jgi:hypothetical protein